MRLPAEEHDRILAAGRALDLGQHALLGALDQLEVLQAERVRLDHLQDQAVAVVARLDAVDLPFQLVLELGDVGKVLQTLVGEVGRHREGVLGALEIGADRFDRAVVEIGPHVAFHGRHPVAEEHVDVLVLHARIGDRHRKDLDLGLVAEALEHHRRGGRGRGDVGPADIGEAHGPAVVRLGRLSRRRPQQGRGTGERQPGVDHASRASGSGSGHRFCLPGIRFMVANRLERNRSPGK